MINPMSTGSPTIKSSTERLCNQRPRKRDCNVLKFHNFVPNKELSCFSRIRGSDENVLTGHCLKEENGSKQINVCNWQKKQQQLITTIENDKNDSSQQSIQLLTKEIPLISNDIVTPTATTNSDDLTSQSILGSLLARNEMNRIKNISTQSNEDLINGYTLINIGDNSVDGDSNAELIAINGNHGFLMPTARTTLATATIKTPNKVNRRKPSTVRRFLRSPESLTNGDGDNEDDDCDYNGDECNYFGKNQSANQDEPLDLSTAKKRPLSRKKGAMQIIKSDQFNQLIDYLPVLIPGTQITSQRLPQTMITPFLPYLLPEHQQQSNLTTTTIKSVNSSKSPPTTGIDPIILLKDGKLLPLLPNNQQNCIPMKLSADAVPANSSLSPSSSSSSSTSSSSSSITSMVGPLNNYLHHSSRGATSTIPGVGHFKLHNNNHPTKISPSSGNNHHLHHNNQYHHQPINRNHNQPGPVNERNTIKAKLENEFRTNGFLVKTKEVSDGEATFCKFRQLRKYTRYYLKSWHQHLPDEINKLWKGFLPPKTSKPTSSSSSSATIHLSTNLPLDNQPNSPSLTLNGQPMDTTSTPYQPSL